MALYRGGSTVTQRTTTPSARTLENPISGERFVFLETSADTDGEPLAMAPLAWLGTRRGLDVRYRSLDGAAAQRRTPVRPPGRSADLRAPAGPSTPRRGSRRPESPGLWR
jgi:hypothetical protein